VPSGLASLLIASEPIWVFLLSSIAVRQWRLNAALLAGILLGFGGRRPADGPKRLEFRPRRVRRLTRDRIGSLSWSVGIVYSRRSHLSGHPLLLSALSLLAGSLQLLLVGTAVGEYRGFRSRRFRCVRGWRSAISSSSARLWLSLLQLASRALFPNPRRHSYLRQPNRRCFIRLVLRGEAVTLNVLLSAALVIGAVMLVDRG